MTDVPPAIDYTSRDYASTVRALYDRAAELVPEWTNRQPTDFGVVMVDLFAWAADVLAYATDRASSEAHIETAVLESSVRNWASLLGYTPVEMAAAYGSITITITSGVADVFIPRGTQFTTEGSGSNGIIFETTEDLTIPGTSEEPPEYTGSVGVVQGITYPYEALGEGNGKLNQSFELFHQNVIYGSVLIDIDSGPGYYPWQRVNDLLSSKPGDTHYMVTTDADGISRVRFGDGHNGAVVPLGAPVRVTYRVGVGAAGNVGPGAITKPFGYIANITGVTNTTATVGGEDRESVDSIRTNAPASINAINRAITLADYAAIALRVPGVAKSAAVAEVSTAVTLYIAPEGGGALSQSLKDLVADYFDDKMAIGTTLAILDPRYADITGELTVNVRDRYEQSLVEARVDQALRDLLSFPNNDFGQVVSLSSVYHTIMAVPGVDFLSVDVWVRSGDPADAANVLCDVDELPRYDEMTLNMVGGFVAEVET